MQWLQNLKSVEAKTPPWPVRALMVAAYVYCAYYGALSLVPPFAPYDVSYMKASHMSTGMIIFYSVYLVDVLMAVSPWHWCNMRSIPPFHIVKHHVPCLIGCTPPLVALLHNHELFVHVLAESPSATLLYASVMLCSVNEALWVGSSFFTQGMLQSKTYRVGQKLCAVTVLAQVVFVCGSMSMLTLAELALDVYYGEPIPATLLCFNFTMASSFVIIPSVQIPLLRGAYTKLIETIKEKDKDKDKDIQITIRIKQE